MDRIQSVTFVRNLALAAFLGAFLFTLQVFGGSSSKFEEHCKDFISEGARLILVWPEDINGVSVGYRVSTQVSTHGLWYFINSNYTAVDVTFTAKFLLKNGKESKVTKGPIRLKPKGSLRTGWAQEGDVFFKETGGIPLKVEISDFTVIPVKKQEN